MEENKALETSTEEVVEKAEVNEQEETKSFEEQLAEIRAENAKLKRANDKLASENAEKKKQLRDRLSQEELQAQEKAELDAKRDEEFNAMKKELSISKFEKNYLSLKYPSDLAHEAAIAQAENDTDSLFKIQQKVMEMQEKELKAQLLKSMPTSPISNSGVSITKEQFSKMSLAERSDLYNKNPEVYKHFTNN